jgi:AsmA protein
MTYPPPPGPGRLEGYHYPDERTGAPTHPPPRPPPRPGPSPVLVGLIYGGIGLLAIAVAAITFVVIAPPTDLIRREIVAQVKSATGRDLSIAGGASFTFFPTLGVRARDVTLSAPPAMGGEPLLTAASVDVGVRLLPLLGQDIVVDRLVLHRPVFALRVDAQGRKSWDMAAAQSPRPVRLAVRLAQAGGNTLMDFSAGKDFSQGADGEPGARAQMPELAGLSLGDIRIDDGTVLYSDARSGGAYRLDAINAQAGLASIAQPLDAKGSVMWAREKIDFDGMLTSPQDLLQERPAKLALNLKGKPFSASYDGTVMLREALSADGAVTGNAASLRALAKWLGTKLPPAPGFGEASIAGQLRASAAAVRLSDAHLALDGATAAGTIGVTTSGTRPHVAADLKVSGLDLGNYLASGAGASPREARQPRPATAPPPAAAPPSGPQSIEDLLQRPGPQAGPQAKGDRQGAGWSDKGLDLATLGLVDADAKLSVANLTYGDLRVDASELSLALKDRVFKTTFADVRLYQGRGKGFFAVDGTGVEAVVGANFQVSGIAAQPLLQDTAGIDWLAGTGDVTLELSGHGASQAAIVGSLNGKSDFAVRNGAIIGFNLGGAVRALSDGKIPDFKSSPAEKTDFSELTGSFLITNGVAKNDDLRLASPLLRASGAGIVDLNQRSLDYVVRPKVVASLAGQGGKTDLTGLEVPLHITGSWEDPAIQPDIQGAINNPGTVEAVKELGKQFKGKNAGEIVEDLFGKKEDGKPSKAEKLLEKFLGK